MGEKRFTWVKFASCFQKGLTLEFQCLSCLEWRSGLGPCTQPNAFLKIWFKNYFFEDATLSINCKGSYQINLDKSLLISVNLHNLEISKLSGKIYLVGKTFLSRKSTLKSNQVKNIFLLVKDFLSLETLYLLIFMIIVKFFRWNYIKFQVGSTNLYFL